MKETPKIVCYCTTIPTVCHRTELDNRTIWTCPKCGKVESQPHGRTFYDGEGISHISEPIPNYRKARGILKPLFTDDPRPAEQIIRDYRDNTKEDLLNDGDESN